MKKALANFLKRRYYSEQLESVQIDYKNAISMLTNTRGQYKELIEEYTELQEQFENLRQDYNRLAVSAEQINLELDERTEELAELQEAYDRDVPEIGDSIGEIGI